jgi:O-antigen biosynthesis alpha-1,2-mannosyltransferase
VTVYSGVDDVFRRHFDRHALDEIRQRYALPVLEAMAAGCPVVTPDRYGTKELAENAAVLVDPESVETIATGIERVLDDDATRARLAAAGRARSEACRWSRCARETLAVLEWVTR